MKRKVFLLSCFSVIYLSAQNTLSIDECRAMAIEHNKSIAIANENLKAANELKKAAFTQFLPNFAANGSYMWNEKNISLLSEDQHLPVVNYTANGQINLPASVNNGWTQINGSYAPLDANGVPFDPTKNPEKLLWKNYALLPKSAMEFEMHNVFAGTIGFTQPIFMGGKIRELYRQAKYAENLAIINKDNKLVDLIIEVDEAYWRVISVQNKLKLATEYKNMLSAINENVATMIETGVATKADLLKVKVKLNEAEVMVLKAENGLNLSRMALNQLCGIALESKTELTDIDLTKTIEPAKLIPIDQAVENRPEIKALNEMKNIAKSNERLMISRFLPTIALAGNYVVSNPNVYNGYENKFGGMFNVGVVAHMPIFHFGEKIHTLNVSKAQQRIAEIQLDEAKEKIQLQIQQNTYKLNESTKQRIATQRNIENATENLNAATEGFDAGVITSTDLLGAQTAWLSAKSEDIDAAINEKMSSLYLNKALANIELPTNITKKNK